MNNLINFVKKNMEDKTDEIRVMIVLQMIVEGIREIDIINFCIDKWGVAVVEAKRYISTAKQELKNAYGAEFKREIVEKNMARLEMLFVANYKNKDYKECRCLIESINKMLGIGGQSIRLQGDLDNPLMMKQINVIELPNNNR